MGSIVNATNAYIEDNGGNKVSILQQKAFPYTSLSGANLSNNSSATVEGKPYSSIGVSSNLIANNYYTYKSYSPINVNSIAQSPWNSIFVSVFTPQWSTTNYTPYANLVWCNTSYVDNGDTTAFTNLSHLLNGNHNQYIVNYGGLYIFDDIWIDSAGYLNIVQTQFRMNSGTLDCSTIANCQGIVSNFPSSIQSRYSQYTDYSQILYGYEFGTPVLVNTQEELMVAFAIV